MTPDDRKYTKDHEWIIARADVVRVGITDYAQDALGDVVFVSLPTVGDTVTAGQNCGEVESTKSVSEIYAPVSGTVTARNDAVETAPETINSDPYGAGWLFEMRVEGETSLLDAATYEALIQEL